MVYGNDTDVVATESEYTTITAQTTFAFVLIPRFNMMALTATIEPLRVANYLTGSPLYAWEFLSLDAGNVVASNGMELATSALPTVDKRYDTIFVCSSWDSEHFSAVCPGQSRHPHSG